MTTPPTRPTPPTPQTPPGPGVPGLQAERTRLAWSRTALGLLGNAALVALRAPHSRLPALTWGTVTAAALAGLFVLVAARRRAGELAAGQAAAGRTRLVVLGVVVAVLCLVVGLDVLVAGTRPS